ncbi:MAG: hypothetical protein U5M53_11925 [Rhodoferax sp.]|nr:hypothetical protein [Rhodoferax sp.]
MFSRFRGKGDKPEPPSEAPDSRGLEVVENDPDTAWSMWDSALADQDSRFSDLPPITESAELAAPSPAELASVTVNIPEPEPTLPAPVDFNFDAPTQPLGLTEMGNAQRMAAALEVVELHHHRIANTIRTLWGYKECGAYINKLIMNGGDGMGNARVGFNQQAVDAMMVLADLHDTEFGAVDASGDIGFGDTGFQAGIHGHR